MGDMYEIAWFNRESEKEDIVTSVPSAKFRDVSDISLDLIMTICHPLSLACPAATPRLGPHILSTQYTPTTQTPPSMP